MASNKRRLVPLSRIRQEPLRWLWPGRIPLGAVSVVDGDPGQSKTTLTLDLAARVTTGRAMPLCEGTTAPAGAVLIQAEDSLGSTVKPALRAAGAAIRRIRVFNRRDFLEQPLLLPDDWQIISAAAKEVRAKLVVIDPLDEFVKGSPNSAQAVRRALGPLAGLAERAGLAVVVLRHLTKNSSGNALYRGLGSIATVALARSALRVASDPDSDDPYGHVLIQTKTNLSAAPSLRYRTVKQGGNILIEWLGESACTAKDLVAAEHDDHSALREATEVLLAILEKGPVSAKDVVRLAREAGVSKRTLDRAKRALRVRSIRSGSGWYSHWEWALPEGVGPGPEGGNKPGGAEAVRAEVKSAATTSGVGQ
jgi:hypothetical protein